MWMIVSGFLLTAAHGGETVTLKNRQSQEIQAEILSADKSSVTILVNRARHTVPLADLDSASAALAVAEAKKAGHFEAFPPVEVEVKVGVQRRNYGSSGYMKQMDVSPAVKIKGRSQIEPLPAAEATILLFYVDTGSKYAKGLESYVVQNAQTVPIPAANNGKSRNIEFTSVSTTYDGDRDSSNVGGRTYKYYAFFLTDPESGHLLHYESNWPSLSKRMEQDEKLRDKVRSLEKDKKIDRDFTI